MGPVGAIDASDDAVDLLADALGEVPVPEVERLESTDDEASYGRMCAAGPRVITGYTFVPAITLR